MLIVTFSDKGRQIIRDLAFVSDVLVENYLPGKLDSWGLGFDDLSKVHRISVKIYT